MQGFVACRNTASIKTCTKNNFFLSVEKKKEKETFHWWPCTRRTRGEKPSVWNDAQMWLTWLDTSEEIKAQKDWKRLMWAWDQKLSCTFHWYLWGHLLLVLSAPFLPVPPLLFGQSRRHTDQTGDSLTWAKSRTDYQRFSAVGSISLAFI